MWRRPRFTLETPRNAFAGLFSSIARQARDARGKLAVMFARALLTLPLFVAAACQLEPDVKCDDTRLAWGWDNHELSPADDVSGEPGLQVDITILSALPAGKAAVLSVTGEDEVETVHPQTTTVAEDGSISFREVSVPTGSVRFTVRTENDCREVESSQRRFVRDNDGAAVCELEFLPPTRDIEGEVLRSYIEADDQDPGLPGFQAAARVVTGRASMSIRLLLLNRDTQMADVAELETDASGSATFPISLTEGEVAIRALCVGGLNEAAQSTATFPILVDIEPPDCDLVEPSSRVSVADDIDGDTAGVQVVAIAQTNDDSNRGLEAEFTVNGETVPGIIGAAGQATAVITVPTASPQEFSLMIPDLAGNTCTQSVSF